MKKKYLITEALKEEDASYTPEKSKEIMENAKKALPIYKDQAERLLNMFEAITIGDLLEHGREELKKYEKALGALIKKEQAFQDALENISSDMMDSGERELGRECRDLEGEYYELYQHLDAFNSIIDKLDTELMDWDDDSLKSLKKYKK